eukprot:IDg4410t1
MQITSPEGQNPFPIILLSQQFEDSKAEVGFIGRHRHSNSVGLKKNWRSGKVPSGMQKDRNA